MLSREAAEEVLHFCSQAFVTNTNHTYSTHWNAFLSFCAFINLHQSLHPLAPFASMPPFWLARSLKFSRIPQYLGITGLLHKEFGLANPLTSNWHISSLITDITHLLGHEQLQKLPVTPSLLVKIFRPLLMLIVWMLHLGYLSDCIIWHFPQISSSCARECSV